MTTSIRFRSKSTKATGEITCPYCGQSFEFSRTVPTRRTEAYRRNEIPGNRKRVDPEELGALLEELSVLEIARLYGVSQKAIEDYCQLFGLTLLPGADLDEEDLQ